MEAWEPNGIEIFGSFPGRNAPTFEQFCDKSNVAGGIN